MPPSGVAIVLEFSRATQADQPHAFSFMPQAYLLRTPGGGTEVAEFPWTPELLAELQALRLPGRDPALVHRIGGVLREFLRDAGWTAHEQTILAAIREGAPITVTIRSSAAELYALPWELLTLKASGQMIGGIPGLLVRYAWPEIASLPDRVAPASRRGRVLFAWSAAAGAVPADGHRAALQAACAGRPGAFDPARDVLAHTSLARLDRALDDAARDGPPIDVVHLLCHGGEVGGTYGLALDDDASPGAAVVVDAGRLQQIFAPHAGMVRLVVIAACDSGNAGAPGNQLGSVAQMIHRAGVEAVVASRYPLSADGSLSFARAFHGARVAPGGSIDRAFLAGRDALLCDPAQLDWASVQLYAAESPGPPMPAQAITPTPPTGDPPARPRPPWILAAALGVAAIAVFAVVAASGDERVEPPADPAAGAAADEPVSSDRQTPVLDAVRRPGKCPGALVVALRRHFQDGRTVGDALIFTVQVQRGGEAVIRDVRGNVELEAKAREHLALLARADLARLGGAALPCRVELTWLP